MTGLKLTLRKLWHNRLFTALNILGLAIGISACWIIFRIAYYEFSFDKSHPNKEDIYQVVNKSFFEGREGGFGGVPLTLYPYISETYPQFAEVVPMYNRGYEEVSIEKPHQEQLIFDDPSEIKSTSVAYFDMVPYQWLVGDPKTAIAQPHQVVLTLSRAKQYFGNIPVDDIIGKTLKYDTTLFTVTGIVADLTKPSSFTGKEFMAIPQHELEGYWGSSNSNHKVFIKIQQQHKKNLLDGLNAKLAEMEKENFEKYNYTTWFDLLPLTEKHFSRDYAAGEYTAEKKIVYGLMGIGGFLLLLACINYINLSTAQVPYRAKEIGIRKTLGERPYKLTAIFLQETFIICILALVLAIPLVKYFGWQFSEFMPPGIQDYKDSIAILLFLGALLGVLTILSGLYPAYLINRVNIVEVMKIHGIGKLSFGNITLRKTLIVFQFVIAQVFVIGTFIIASQIDFLLRTDLGFDKQAVVTIKMPYKKKETAGSDPFLYKQALQQYPEIAKVALGHLPLNNNHWGNTLFAQSDTGEVHLNMNFKYTDPEYMEVYGIRILAGRSPQAADTTGTVFLNETARARLGFKSNELAVGQTLKDPSGNLFIIQGIFNDFHSKYLHAPKEPLAIHVTTRKSSLGAINIKLFNQPSEWPKALDAMEKEWKNFYPNAPFTYKFYDEELKALYESDIRQARMINLSTVVTIVLSCLGLIGLVTLTAFQRTKEIGIRKVLGSTVTGIIALLSKDYIKLILIAIIIATPIGWWAMNKWLQDFAYRIDIKWWMLLTAGIATIVMALLSVSYQAWKAARANPVDSLRDE